MSSYENNKFFQQNIFELIHFKTCDSLVTKCK